MVRVPGSSGDLGYHRESSHEETKIRVEPGSSGVSTEGVLPSSHLKSEEYTERQSPGRSSGGDKEKGSAMDLEGKPHPPPLGPSGPPAARDASCNPPDEDPTKSKKTTPKPAKMKLNAPDADESGDAKTWTENDLRVILYRKKLRAFLIDDPVMKLMKRFEMHASKRKADEDGGISFDNKTGAAAVVRSLKTVLNEITRHQWHLVVIDRFYTSILHVVGLLGMGVYVSGTIMTERLEYPKEVRETRKTQRAAISRGTFAFASSVDVPPMIAFHWWDRKPVHCWCTGSAIAASTINRNGKQIGSVTGACPAAVNDYQRWMGRVDVHDQLRLQTFSLQTSTRFSNYYKSLFLDLALVNAFIAHMETTRLTRITAMTRGEWFCVVQNQLLQLKADASAGVVVTPLPSSMKRTRAPTRLTHELELSKGWVTVSGVQKRCQWSCKVCALLRTNPKKTSIATTYFCERCSVDNAKCWLCNKLCHTYKGETKTCFAIWHDDFDCGQSIPASLGKKVVLRRPGKKTDERKKTRRELELHGNEADDEGITGNGGGSDGE